MDSKRNIVMDTPDTSEGGSIDSEDNRGPEAKRMRRQDDQLQRDAADDDVPGSDDSDSSSGDDDGIDDSDVDVVGGGGGRSSPAAESREIQVEFEARSPQECDYYGLIHLLKQMLKPSSVNMSELADRIISQKAVGSVITQSPEDNDETDDDDDDGENAGALANGGGINRSNGGEVIHPNEVFGVGTVLKLVHGSSDPVGDQIVSHLLINTAKSPKAAELRSFLNDPANSPGFLISERILNMPPQISVPMYETLLKEIRKAVSKNLQSFAFSHFVMISRQFVSPNDERTVIFTNAEEEVFVQECDMVLDMECGAGMSSTRADTSSGRPFSSMTSDEYLEKRKLLIFRAHNLEKITSLVKGAFPIN